MLESAWSGESDLAADCKGCADRLHDVVASGRHTGNARNFLARQNQERRTPALCRGRDIQMPGYKVIWEEALKDLRESIPDFNFKTFFMHAEPFYEDGGTYYFEQHNEAEKIVMEKKYGQRVKDALEAAQSRLGVPQQPIQVIYMDPQEAQEYRKNMKEEEPEPEEPDVDALFNASPHSGDPTAKGLNPAYTFDSFVVGEPNEFASAAARAVAENPGQTHNPLFLYGGAGLGKTHLMHAIGNYVLHEDPNTRILYVTSETFTNELISMIRSAGGTEQREGFRNKYRKVDILMIDDIQFIAGKETTQVEFFNTFNELYDDRKQIVISSDRQPKELVQLDERMRSRFAWGLVADIQAPDYETSVAILIRKAAETPGVPPVDEDVFDYIAQQPNENIRSLEGALQRVIAFAKVRKVDRIDRSLAEEALRELFHSQTQKAITPKLVCDVVCSFYNIDEKDLRGPKRPKEIAFPRQIAMYLLRQMTTLSLAKIAEYFNRKDHTTVIHATKQVSQAIGRDPAVKKDVSDITARLRNK